MKYVINSACMFTRHGANWKNKINFLFSFNLKNKKNAFQFSVDLLQNDLHHTWFI